jgi:hypothetical protein
MVGCFHLVPEVVDDMGKQGVQGETYAERCAPKTIGYLFFILGSQEVTTALRCELKLVIPTAWSIHHGTL